MPTQTLPNVIGSEDKRSTRTQYLGLYRGSVEYNDDPENLGRIKIRLDVINDQSQTAIPSIALKWALPCWSPGSYQVPEVGDTAWVMFQNGDVNYPVYLGGWPGNFDENRVKGRLGGFSHPSGVNNEERSASRGVPVTPAANNPYTYYEPVGNEAPEESYKKRSTSVPAVRVPFKTARGHTLYTQDEPGREEMRLIDRLGQSIVFKCPVILKTKRNNVVANDYTYGGAYESNGVPNPIPNNTPIAGGGGSEGPSSENPGGGTGGTGGVSGGGVGGAAECQAPFTPPNGSWQKIQRLDEKIRTGFYSEGGIAGIFLEGSAYWKFELPYDAYEIDLLFGQVQDDWPHDYTSLKIYNGPTLAWDCGAVPGGTTNAVYRIHNFRPEEFSGFVKGLGSNNTTTPVAFAGVYYFHLEGNGKYVIWGNFYDKDRKSIYYNHPTACDKPPDDGSGGGAGGDPDPGGDYQPPENPSDTAAPFAADWLLLQKKKSSNDHGLPTNAHIGEIVYFKFPTIQNPKEINILAGDFFIVPSASFAGNPGRWQIRLFLGNQLLATSDILDKPLLKFKDAGQMRPGIYFVEVKNVGNHNANRWEGRLWGTAKNGAALHVSDLAPTTADSVALNSMPVASNDIDEPFGYDWETVKFPSSTSPSHYSTDNGPGAGGINYYKIQIHEKATLLTISYEELEDPKNANFDATLFRGTTQVDRKTADGSSGSFFIEMAHAGNYYLILENKGTTLNKFKLDWSATNDAGQISPNEPNASFEASSTLEVQTEQAAALATSSEASGPPTFTNSLLSKDEVPVNIGNMMRRGMRDYNDGDGVPIKFANGGRAQLQITDANKQKLWFTATNAGKAVILLSGRGGFMEIKEDPGTVFIKSKMGASVLVDDGVRAQSIQNDFMEVKNGNALLHGVAQVVIDAGSGGKIRIAGGYIFLNSLTLWITATLLFELLINYQII